MNSVPVQPDVLLFDVNETLLDLSELRRSVAGVFDDKEDIVSLWFETLLHYSLVSTLCDEYKNFGEIGAATLVMVAERKGIKLTMEKAGQVLDPIRTAPPHPDVPGTLKNLRDRGYRLATLTNSSREGTEAQLKKAGIAGYFEQRLSVEEIELYKPHRRTYRWAARRLNVEPENCLFVAAHGWDVAGAMAAGMTSVFINRPGQTLYPLAPAPAYIEPDLRRLAHRLK